MATPNPKRREDPADPKAEGQDPQDPADPKAEGQDPQDPADPTPEPDITKDPAVRMAIARAAKKARQDAMAEAEAAAKLEADRAKLDELERTKVELAEARALATTAKAASEAATRDRDLTDALLTGGHRLAGGAALKFVRQAVGEAMAEDQALDTESALAAVLKANPFLVHQDPVAGAPAARGATTAPAVKVPGSPVAKDPSPPVDVLNMSAAEYTAYRQKTHGA